MDVMELGKEAHMVVDSRVIWTDPVTGIEHPGTLLGSIGHGFLSVRLDAPLDGEDTILATRAELRPEEEPDA